MRIRVMTVDGDAYEGWLVTALEKPQLNGFKLFRSLDNWPEEYTYLADRMIFSIDVVDWDGNV